MARRFKVIFSKPDGSKFEDTIHESFLRGALPQVLSTIEKEYHAHHLPPPHNNLNKFQLSHSHDLFHNDLKYIHSALAFSPHCALCWDFAAVNGLLIGCLMVLLRLLSSVLGVNELCAKAVKGECDGKNRKE